MNTRRTPRVAIYARVSALDQKADLQLDALRDLSARRGWAIFEEYVDIGISGSKDRRPSLDKLVTDADRRRFDVVAIWKLDRLARSVRHLVLLADELRALGIDLVSAEDTIDTTTASRRFTFHISGAVAELERELIRERTIGGLSAAVRRGVKLGRRPVHVDLGWARDLRTAGRSYREIAATLNVSVGLVHRLLNVEFGPRSAARVLII